MVTALLKIVNDMLEAVDLGRITVLVAVDLSGTFDTIDHSILLSTLESSFEVTVPALTWVRLYLTDRTSFVKVVSASKPIAFCNIGVPQGSILWRLLFSLY